MPYKKPNVFTQIIYALQKRKSANEDIVTTADKIIEEYISNKNKLIHRKCKKEGNSDLALVIVAIVSVLTIAVALCIVF